MSTSARSFYRPELDALRFFAFLGVFVNHTLRMSVVAGRHAPVATALLTGINAVAVAGGFGLDLFFLLSAYLICDLLLREKQQRGTIDIGAFYVRRILRIWPLYIAFLLGCVAWHGVAPTREQMTWHYAMWFFAFLGNWMFIVHPIVTVAAPLWSISVEEQFYLCWPWLIRWTSERGLAGVAAALLGFAFVTRCFLALVGAPPMAIWRNTLAHADPIAVGILMAVLLRGEKPVAGGYFSRPVHPGVMMVASVAALYGIALTFQFTATPLYVGRMALEYPLVALACAALLVGCLSSRGALAAILRNSSLVYLGKISYGLYVFQQIGLMVGDRLTKGHRNTSATAFAVYWLSSLVVTVVIASISYRWLERPFLRLKRRFTPDGGHPVPVLDRFGVMAARRA